MIKLRDLQMASFKDICTELLDAIKSTDSKLAVAGMRFFFLKKNWNLYKEIPIIFYLAMISISTIYVNSSLS